MLKTLYRYESVFKEELGDSFNPEIFMVELENRESSLAKSIHHSDRLLGIMLGYGNRNATLFQERLSLLKKITKRKKENLEPDFELIHQFELIDSQLSDFNEFEENPFTIPLNFFADMSHPESEEFKEIYTIERAQVEALMRQPKFREKVMRRLVE